VSKRYKFVAAMTLLALPLAACSTSSSGSSNSSSAAATSAAAVAATSAAAGGTSGQAIRIDVITHGNPGDSFWDVVKSGAVKAGKDDGVDLHYQSDSDVGKQATLIDAAVAAGTKGLVVSMANPDGLEKSIKAAVAAGIPVVTINSGIDKWQGFGAITHVGQSETLAGEAAGAQMSKLGVKNVLCVIQEAGNVGLEQRCKGAASKFSGKLTNLQVDNKDLTGSEATIQSKITADSTIDGVLTLGGDMSGQAVKAVAAVGTKLQVGTFDVNADVVQNVLDGKLAFAIDQQPYVQGYLGVTAVYLKVLNGNDVGGGQPVYSGPAIITKDNAQAVLAFAKNGTR
jgi:simple sugar transport system substrate-binding protein